MKLHKFDSLSFVAGAIMVVLGLIFLIPANPTDIFDGINDVGAWLWPTLFLMVAGSRADPNPLSGRKSGRRFHRRRQSLRPEPVERT